MGLSPGGHLYMWGFIMRFDEKTAWGYTRGRWHLPPKMGLIHHITPFLELWIFFLAYKIWFAYTYFSEWFPSHFFGGFMNLSWASSTSCRCFFQAQLFWRALWSLFEKLFTNSVLIWILFGVKNFGKSKKLSFHRLTLSTSPPIAEGFYGHFSI